MNKTAMALQPISNGGQCTFDMFDRSNAVQCNEYVFKTDEYRLIRQVIERECSLPNYDISGQHSVIQAIPFFFFVQPNLVYV